MTPVVGITIRLLAATISAMLIVQFLIGMASAGVPCA